MKSLTGLTVLFFFSTIKMKSLSTITTPFSHYTDTSYISTISIKIITLTALFYFTTIKVKSLNTLTTLFYFTTIKMKSLTTLTMPFKFTTIKT